VGSIGFEPSACEPIDPWPRDISSYPNRDRLTQDLARLYRYMKTPIEKPHYTRVEKLPFIPIGVIDYKWEYESLFCNYRLGNRK
jgi:hypothetical protein